VSLDGRRQRRALTAAQRAIQLLAEGDPAGARRAAATATGLDQVGAFGGLVDAVDEAAAEIVQTGMLSPAGRRTMRDALPPGPLAAAAETLLAGDG
jgi:hypothetical protein